MIESVEQLQQAIEQMGRMQRILESYRADILPKNPRNFAIFEEGPLDEIRKLEDARLEGSIFLRQAFPEVPALLLSCARKRRARIRWPLRSVRQTPRRSYACCSTRSRPIP